MTFMPSDTQLLKSDSVGRVQTPAESLYENSNACGEEVRAGESVGNIEEKVHFH
jgi:hypothetical protein